MLSVTPKLRIMVRRDDTIVEKIGEAGLGWKANYTINKGRNNRNIVQMVAEYGEQVVGFMMYELQAKEIHLLNIGVRREFYRNQIGATMIDKLLSKLHLDRRTKAVVVVPDTFLPMHCLLRKHGFHAVKVLRRQFGDADGYRFVFSLT